MKKLNDFKIRYVISIILGVVLFTAGSCKKDADPNVIFKATINSASEVPTNASAATGTATLTYNKDTKVFNVVVNFSGVTASSAHIHKGEAGVIGDVAFGFTSPVTSPINYTSIALTATQEADLYASMYYVNIHSTAFPGGEIRGQLIQQ
jgi:hypothetical protein